MGRLTLAVLRVVIALSLAGSVFVQVVIVPLVWVDLENEPLAGRVSLVVLAVLGIVTMQVFAVCVWQLLALVGRGAVFSDAAFRYVDIIIGAIAAASVLALVLAVLLAPGGAAPGVVALVGGASFVLGGMALLVVVMRTLLAQAIAREQEALQLRAELSEVI
ncbi:DUF2975 domain-containing protein [Microbacterium sp. RD1]|uniref:DUF2975 domain-containing protein n=1 Tax=Microbacterium sp. RD1 TaxID=3457313 RepID=UPI003FA59BB4